MVNSLSYCVTLMKSDAIELLARNGYWRTRHVSKFHLVRCNECSTGVGAVFTHAAQILRDARRLWMLGWTVALLLTRALGQLNSTYLLRSLRRRSAGLWTRPYVRRCVQNVP